MTRSCNLHRPERNRRKQKVSAFKRRSAPCLTGENRNVHIACAETSQNLRFSSEGQLTPQVRVLLLKRRHSFKNRLHHTGVRCRDLQALGMLPAPPALPAPHSETCQPFPSSRNRPAQTREGRQAKSYTPSQPVLSMPGAAAARCGSIFERSGLFPKPAWCCWPGDRSPA